jgi:hypothetical protein
MDLSDQFGHPPKIILLDNCDYPTRIAAHILPTQAATIMESGPDERHILILRP